MFSMKLLGALLSVLLVHVVAGSDDHYEVPEPLVDVYTPKGLRISLPDSRNVKSVEFFVTLPTCPDPLIQEVNHTNGGYWVYWNPDAALRLHDKLRYKLMIQRNDVYWKKEGTHVVQKVSPMTNSTDCPDAQGQKLIAPIPALGAFQERNKQMLTTAKTSNLKSSYSTQKTSDLKPITKSSISTTSGTFFIKPSGVMEATGYKKASSFDSSKREGEQWEHHQSELTAEELENMKNLYGSGLRDFPHLHSTLFPAGSNSYEKSQYMSSESKSFPPILPSFRYADSQPLTTHKFHETHQTHETSSFSHSKPVFQFGDSSTGTSYESNAQSEKHYRMEPLTSLPNPLPPQGTIFKATEYIRQEHTLPATGEVTTLRESHRSSVPQKLVQGEFSSQKQEIVRPVFEGRGDQMEYNAGSVRTVERQESGSRHYLGNIFTSVRNTKVKSPQECSLVPGVDYTPSAGLREVDRKVHELSCLATLAESTMKEELALLRQKNSDLVRKLELLEHEVKRISGTCNCY